MKKRLLATALAYAQLCAGVLLTALSFNLFFIQNDIAPGGLTGVATLLRQLFGLRIGLTSALLNIPLFLLGYRAVGRSFAFRSLLAMLALSALIDLLPVLSLTEDRILAAVYGGILMGVGIGLVMRGGATTGGTDMAAMLVHRRIPALSVGTMLFLIDFAVVLSAGFVFDAQSALYALIAVLLGSKVTDLVVQGWNTSMQFFIISNQAEVIAQRITKEMERGATLLNATGAFSGEPRGMLYCVVNRAEVSQIKDIVAAEDPTAFVTLSAVREAMGEGFAGLKPPARRHRRRKESKETDATDATK